MKKLTFCILILLPLILMAHVVNLPIFSDKAAETGTKDGQRAWRIDYLLVDDWNDTDFVANEKTEIVYEQSTEGAPHQINNFYWSLDHWAQNVNLNYLYGDDSNLIQQADHNLFTGTEPTPNYKYTYSYDDTDHLTNVYMYQYRAVTSTWAAYKRVHLIYTNGFLTSTVEWRDNFGNVGYDRYDYTYGADNKVATKTRLYCTDSLSWVTTNQEQYTYHVNDYTTNNGYLNYFTHTYPITYPLQQSDIPGFSTYGMPQQILDSYWIGGQWMLISRKTYTYNAANKPTEFLEEVKAGDVWMNDQRWVMTYDANGNPEYQTFQDYENNAWANQYRIAYFWNQFTGSEDANIPPISELNFNVYPSPFTNDFRIEATSKQTQPITIQVYNPKGQCLQSQTSNPNQTVNIDGSHLANGIYFIKAAQGISTQIRKVIKIK